MAETTTKDQLWASYLQAIQLVDAIGKCLPVQDRPILKPSVSSRLKVIENNCREISEYLEAHMDTENMEEFLDLNGEMYRFMQAFHRMPEAQRLAMMQSMEGVRG